MHFVKSLPRYFFNILYRFFPPEMVSYWKTKDSARARVKNQRMGPMGLEIEGEKYVMPGLPRGHVLFAGVSKAKHKVKTAFNVAYEAIQELLTESKYDVLPYEKLLPPVKALWDAFEDLKNAEITEDMKERVKIWQTVLCWLMNEDDAYRFRMQWLLERVDMRKMRLTKADKYFFRGKYFKVDFKRRFLGIDWRIFDY